ncbi:MAG: long-chain fatty acid--CoA ligase [Acidobacteria bacterium RIFCSPLOWO2_02_FULL_68_18]|nr:MAG: long-chain fatty acid--CoA ligase [Acidobacteria bacterium RIFCSPLOWO2_02_FULL_68_18]OFW49345.1 MAG: long-chain fatty acid--CoA ligase [Acidobacteria bacterium RIFCSPLOWO2_12_FULL_68_19]
MAIVCGGRRHTYDDLDGSSRQVAAALLAGENDLREARIAFLAPPGFEYAAVQRGIWRAGGVAVPLATSHPPPELEYVIRDSAASVVVADPASTGPLAPIARAAGVRFAPVEGLLTVPAAPPDELPHLGPSRRAMIVYTSGTTARPKGVVSTHANIGAQVASLVEIWEWTPEDRLLLALPLHHLHGIINGLGSALAVRATCEMLPAFDALTVWDRFGSGEITVFTGVPAMYQRLIAAWEAAPPAARRAWSDGARRVRLMMSGSAALPLQTLARWREITGHTLLERYGMTEMCMALSNPLHGERRPGFVGTPVPGIEVRLVDENGRVVSDGTPGEIEVRGQAVFLEYWQRPADTHAAFRDGWFRTGDVAVREHGAYRLLGRTSVDIIKTGGFKVSALEIEEVVRTHPAIAECAIVGIADEQWGERVAVAVELQSAAALSLPELQDWAKARLAPYKVPRALRVVEALPRNAVGKILKPDVASLFGASDNASGPERRDLGGGKAQIAQ